MAVGTTSTGVTAPTAVAPGRSVGWVTAAVVVLGSALLLLSQGTPLRDLVTYAVHLVVGVVAPGTVVHKALRGPQGSWLEDLSLGVATGLVLGLGAWAIFSLLDARSVLWAWPALALLVLVSPRARGRVRARPLARWPAGPTILLGVAALIVVWHLFTTFVSVFGLPPTDRPYYPDLLWHLGLAGEAVRSFPLQTPQVLDAGTLRYHWFSNASVAASSLMTGVDVPTIMLRLWVLPMGVLFVTLTAALTVRVCGRPWAAAGAAWIAVPMVTFPFWPTVLPRLEHLSGNSPSQLFAYPLVLLTLHALVDVVRRTGPAAGTWGAALLGALGCSGAKSSALPVVVGGLALALLVALVRRRSRVLLLAVTGSAVLLTGLALVLVAGGDSGAGVQLFSSLTVMEPYRVLAGSTARFDTLVPVGLFGAPGPGPILLVGLLLAIALTTVRSLAFVVLPFSRRLRADLAAWLLAGVCACAFLPFFVLGHPGYSEYYFLYATIPVGSALWMWWLSESVHRSRLSSQKLAVIGAAAAAVPLALGSPVAPHGAAISPDEMSSTLVRFIVTVVGVTTVAAGLAALVRRRAGRPGRRPVAGILAVVVMSGVLVGSSLLEALNGPRDPGVFQAEPSPVVAAQTRAAMWIRQHVPDSAVLATNVHCLSGSGLRCDSRSWWISGLAGRRVLLEGWSYVPRAAHVGYYDPGLLALNQAAFSAPTPAVLTDLRSRGVSWLVAERVAGHQTSARLDLLATRRWSNDLVTIYELR